MGGPGGLSLKVTVITNVLPWRLDLDLLLLSLFLYNCKSPLFSTYIGPSKTFSLQDLW